MSHFVTHGLLNEFSTSRDRITTLLMTAIDGAPETSTSPSGNTSLFTSVPTWTPSLTPLCANPTATPLTHLLLSHALTVPLVAYARHIVTPKLLPPTSTPAAHPRTPTITSETKRTLRNDESILALAARLVDGMTSKEAVCTIPQSVVEVCWKLGEREERRRMQEGGTSEADDEDHEDHPAVSSNLDTYILNLFFLPLLPLLLTDPHHHTTLPLSYAHFAPLPAALTSWWSQFTDAVSPRQAQFVPGLTVKQFEQEFKCPSWVGVAWCFWRLVQTAFDLDTVAGTGGVDRTEMMISGRVSPTTNLETSRRTATANNTSHYPSTHPTFGTDITAAAQLYKKKLSAFKRNILLLSPNYCAKQASRHISIPPPLDPVSLNKRLVSQTPKCKEIVAVSVVSSAELKGIVGLLDEYITVNPGLYTGEIAQCVVDTRTRVRELVDDAVYLVHLPVDEKTMDEGTSEDGWEGGEGNVWPRAPAAPPPPPLPTRSSGMLKMKESYEATVRRAEEREIRLRKGVEVVLGYKEALERMKRKAVVTVQLFEKRSDPRSGSGKNANVSTYVRERSEHISLASLTGTHSLNRYSQPH